MQVVYATLAIILGGSLVLFGIGSDAPGGILDAVGLGSDDGSDNPQYEQQIENAEEKLATDPEDPVALLNLVRYHYLSATDGVVTNPETGQLEITEDASTELEDSVAAWERYLETKPKRANAAAASNASQAYRLLNDAGGAARAQEVVAEAQQTSAAYGQLAFYLYADFQFDAGDAAAEQAIAEADASDRKQIEQSLEQLAESARKQERLADRAAEAGGAEAGEQQLTDPFGALGGAGDAGVTPPGG